MNKNWLIINTQRLKDKTLFLYDDVNRSMDLSFSTCMCSCLTLLACVSEAQLISLILWAGPPVQREPPQACVQMPPPARRVRCCALR